MSEHHIVVGYDGSRDAEAAVRWAVTQAHLTGARLDIVHSYDFPYLERLDHATQGRLLHRAIAREGARLAGGLQSAVTVRAVVRVGNPAHVLLEAAAAADLLVVGNRGESRAHHNILGSVATKCVHHAPCSVAVIRGMNAEPDPIRPR
jgi:nucleotide-binding universal stress UspA family protein